MAMDFNVKQAKQLINRHKELISNLEYIAKKAAGMNADVRRSANDLVTLSILKRLIINDCTRPSDIQTRRSEVERLIHNLYKYQTVHLTVETAKSFQIYATTNVQPNIKTLNPGLAGLSWFFGGKRAKENAAQAYQELTRILSEDYGQMIPSLVSDMDSTVHVTTDTAWEAFIADPCSFADTLEMLCPKIAYSSGNSPFQTQFTQLDNLEQKVVNCQTVTDKEKNQIKDAAEKMTAYNALQILSGVPVDEVNREKGGFRVKTLRDAGFTTMADIHSASVQQLVSLNGISENAASSLKMIANRFLTEAQGSAKIKLNADDRSKQATDLVKAIYIYRQKNAVRAELNDLIQERKPLLTHAQEVLKSVGNGLPWLFYSIEQRGDVQAAYTEIKSTVDGEYARTITRLTNSLLMGKTTPSADAVWNDFKEHSIEYISVLEEVVPNALGEDESLYGLPEDLAKEIQAQTILSEGLLCTLRHYQEWGVKYILHQKKVLLGDEMGLGKTVQAIAAMVSLRNTGATHFLVVCPASVVTNWCREVAKHSDLCVTKIHGDDRTQALESWVSTGGVAVTTFEMTAHITSDSIGKIDFMNVDEAHYIKNPEARRSINVKRLCDKAECLLFMTGTALENRVEEMVTLIDVLQPSIASSVQNMTFMPNAPQFRNRIAPVYCRRRREDVLTELPELIEKKEWCTLYPDEREIYERNVLSESFAASRRLSWDADDLNKSCKAVRLLEIIEKAKAEDRKVLVFSFFLDTISTIEKLTGTACYGPINGSVPPQRRQEIIDAFDKAPAGSVLLAQIQSGGTGLNIQSASVVVICEPQFKPSIENQAISRAYRMGQSRNVLVFRLLCVDTIDEKITELLESKQDIFDAFADTSVIAEESEAHSIEVDDKKFGQLMQEEIDRIKAEKSVAQAQSVE